MADFEESAPLLDIEEQPNIRHSEEETHAPLPATRDDGSSKESSINAAASVHQLNVASPRPDSQELPAPVTHSNPDRRRNFVSHLALLLPRFILSLLWFGLYLTFGGGSIVYLSCWCLMQMFTGFTRAEWDSRMVRRDLGGFFDALMDLFERIWA
ncbi:hypothetical protein NA57DRAFT_75803 [Rhizodiscina lignyota]|uniref:Uncharacterized protein n=1 Tax=Rhizodiscina lignyota TaxID=1504668 RepID=A0A9P4M5W3_9PEZI|nr:hypothetical protein NA57DRAFT_75803 [Rhizodiscina lignyota]